MMVVVVVVEEIALFAPHFQLRIRSDILKKEKKEKKNYMLTGV